MVLRLSKHQALLIAPSVLISQIMNHAFMIMVALIMRMVMNKKEKKQLEELEKLLAKKENPIDENQVARDRLKLTLHQLADDLAEVLSAPVKAPAPANDEMDIFSPEQLTKRLGIVKGTLATWRREGRGPKFFKEGKNIYYRAHDVKAWINDSPKYSKNAEQYL